MMASPLPALKLSIVIAAWNGNAALERCLMSLRRDGEAADTEVIVVTNFAAEMLESRFRYVQHVSMPPGSTVPVLRTAGICCSGGEIVALAEDHCTFGENWCSEL